MQKRIGILIGIGIVFVGSCEVKQLQSETQLRKPAEKGAIWSQSKEAEADLAKYDLLNLDQTRIEGKMKLHCLKKEMETLFGKPTQIVVQNECDAFFGDESAENAYYYYGQTVFEGSKDSIALRSLHFGASNLRLVCPQTVLSKETQLEDLKLIFPKSFAHQYPIVGAQSPERIVVALLPCNHCDAKWLFIFENQKLVEVQYHMDC